MQTQRTCVACRTRTSPTNLIRIAIRAGEWVVQPWPSSDGRTTYVCPTALCVEQGLKKQRFQRSLKTTADAISTENLLRGAEAAETQKLRRLVGGAQRGRLLNESERFVSADPAPSLEGRIAHSKARLAAIRHQVATVSKQGIAHRTS